METTGELQQQISTLNARINSTNLSYADLLREMDNTIKALATTIAALQKENAILKEKTKTENQKVQ